MVLTEHLPPTNGLGFKSSGRRHIWVDCWFSPLFRIFFSKNQHFHLLPFDLDHEHRTRFNPMSGKQIPKSGKFLFPESVIRKILPVESEILGFGFRNTAQGIWNSTDDWNPESKLH